MLSVSLAARVLGLSGFEEVTSGLLSLSHFDLRTVVERGETLLAAGPQVWVDFGRNLSPKCVQCPAWCVPAIASLAVHRDRAALQRAAILSQLGLEAASDDARAAQRFDGAYFAPFHPLPPADAVSVLAGLSEAVTEDDLFAADAAEVARQAALKACVRACCRLPMSVRSFVSFRSQLEQYRAKPLSELVAEVNASGALSARMKNKARRQLASGRAAPVPSAPPLVTTATECVHYLASLCCTLVS